MIKELYDIFECIKEISGCKVLWYRKDIVITPIEDFFGIRIGEYRNFIEVE